ncbi:MAG: helix-turn-helix transcriptional regulator [Ruminococcaceae bacterium]|nr:helix-turn-helix transcriptional regulator [Oscillospiraceae bacterium]
MKIVNIRHEMLKNAGYMVDRPYGRTHYTFAHYASSVQLRCGETSYTTKPGACIVFTPETSQWLFSSQPLVHNWLHLDVSVRDLLDTYQIPLNMPFYPREHSKIFHFFEQMEQEFFGTAPFREKLLDSYLQEFLIWLHRSLQMPNSPSVSPGIPAEKIRKARITILTEPERKWTLEEMAALVPLSPSRFHTLYKQLFGVTPTRELIQRRITLAQELLRTNQDLTLAQIASLLGYQEQYHFIRQFKSVTGQTPGSYRKNYKL